MRNKDERDDIWISRISGWWLTGYLVGFGIGATTLIIKSLDWLGSQHPAIAGFVVLGALTGIFIWLPRKAMKIPFEGDGTKPLPSPADAPALMPSDVDLDTEFRLLIIATEEQRRTGDDK